MDYSGVEQHSELVAATPFEGDWVVTVDVSTNKSRLLPGDELVVTVGASNRGETVLVDARIWVTLPSGRSFELLSVDSAFLDGGVAVLADLLSYTFSERDASGEYIITCMITDSDTRNVVSYGVTTFVLTRRASILPPADWRLDPRSDVVAGLDMGMDNMIITQ